MEYPKMPSKPVKPENSTQKKTAEGPHGGGNQYNQAKLGSGFMVHDPISGHEQKSNLKDKS